MSKSFALEQRRDRKNRLVYSICGAINEFSDYSSFQFDDEPEVIIDMKETTYINSTGIKGWMGWVSKKSEALPDLQFIFTNVPKCIIDQLNMIRGFMPKNYRIESFQVPFFCEKCEKDTELTFKREEEFFVEKEDFRLNPPNPVCGEKDCEIEMDVANRYFAFLKPN